MEEKTNTFTIKICQNKNDRRIVGFIQTLQETVWWNAEGQVSHKDTLGVPCIQSLIWVKSKILLLLENRQSMEKYAPSVD